VVYTVEQWFKEERGNSNIKTNKNDTNARLQSAFSKELATFQCSNQRLSGSVVR